MRVRRPLVATLVAIAASFSLVACGGSPTAPDPGPVVPTTITLRVIDGLTNAPVVGATVKSGSVVGTTNNDGQVTLTGNGLSTGSVIVVNGVTGYRERNTLFCGADKPISLWQNMAGGVDEAITEALGYDAGHLQYPTSVRLLPSAEISADPIALAVLHNAAAKVVVAVEGKTSISVGGAAGATYEVRINPTIPTGGQTTRGGSVGLIEFRTLQNARSLSLATHEVAWTLGLGGPSPYPGLMSTVIQSTEFTPAELGVLRLRYTRPVGAKYAGDNDTSVPCSQR